MKGLGAVLDHIADDIPSLVKATSLTPTEKINKEVNDYYAFVRQVCHLNESFPSLDTFVINIGTAYCQKI